MSICTVAQVSRKKRIVQSSRVEGVNTFKNMWITRSDVAARIHTHSVQRRPHRWSDGCGKTEKRESENNN